MNTVLDAEALENAADTNRDAWRGFRGEDWRDDIAVRDFIRQNHTEYTGDEGFLAGPTERTRRQRAVFDGLLRQERENGGVLAVVAGRVAGIGAQDPGYIDRQNEAVVGLQTGVPLGRAVFPPGGLGLVEQSLREHGLPALAPEIADLYRQWHRDHHDAVFDVQPAEVLAARQSGLLADLPEAGGRDRLVGCFRRVALYGVDRLIAVKQADKAKLEHFEFSDDIIRLREEIAGQLRALEDLKDLASSYGFDISRPARDAREAVQWLYFAFLGALRQGNGAAIPAGRITTFLDIYIERDLAEGSLTEAGAQELLDHLAIKFRAVRHLRPRAFDRLYAGDPARIALSLAGMGDDGRTLVSKTCFRVLHSLENLGNSPEPNLTVLWSPRLPAGFRRYAARLAIDTGAIQVVSDEAIRPIHGDDAGISGCASAMASGKAMQFSGPPCNLLKVLLYAINGGRDEVSGALVAPGFAPIAGDYLDFDEVKERFEDMMEYTARIYIKALNATHYLQDKYAYEALPFALLDTHHHRTLACGIAGLSHVADSLAAIRYGRIRAIRNEAGLAVDFVNEGGAFPCYGNDDQRADELAAWATRSFMQKLRRHRAYKNAMVSQNALTGSGGLACGAATGNAPDSSGPGGRRAGQPFAPGASPSRGQDRKGCLAAASSLARIPFEDCGDGLSWTLALPPDALGRTAAERIGRLAAFIDGFVEKGGYHLEINAVSREMLAEAMERGAGKSPDNLCLRVSGYGVFFHRLSRRQQEELLGRG